MRIAPALSRARANPNGRVPWRVRTARLGLTFLGATAVGVTVLAVELSLHAARTVVYPARNVPPATPEGLPPPPPGASNTGSIGNGFEANLANVTANRIKKPMPSACST